MPNELLSAELLAVDRAPTPVTLAQLRALLDTIYLALAGGTMTGNLILAGAPTTALMAATKAYVDAAAGAAAYSGARVTFATVQSIPDATATTVAWDTESFDVGGYHDNAVNNSRLTVPTTGKYRVSWRVLFASNSGQRYLILKKNGAVIADQYAQVASGFVTVTSCDELSLVAGDYLEVVVTQYSGVPLDIKGDSWDPGASAFSISFIGA